MIWDKTEGAGKLGHSAIKIGGLTFGYYPTGGEYELAPGKMRIINEKDMRDFYGGEWVSEFHLNLSTDQLTKLYTELYKWNDKPGNYFFLGNQCTSVVVDCLVAAGIPLMQDVMH